MSDEQSDLLKDGRLRCRGCGRYRSVPEV